MSNRHFQTKLLMAEFVTHDVKRLIVEKPHNYVFEPGQATLITIDDPLWIDQPRPFTFTSLNDDLVLEFIIKNYSTDTYCDHHGMTEALHQLKPGADLLIGEPWGTIQYNGPGVFVAGGAGITPFISIFRRLQQRNALQNQTLFFSNKVSGDVILEKELRDMFKSSHQQTSARKRLVLTLTREKKNNGFEFGRINQEFLDQHLVDFKQKFYLCGPPAMVKNLQSSLKNLGADAQSLVFEDQQ